MDLNLWNYLRQDDVVGPEVLVNLDAINIGGSNVFLSQNAPKRSVQQLIADAQNAAFCKSLVHDFNASRHHVAHDWKNRLVPGCVYSYQNVLQIQGC